MNPQPKIAYLCTTFPKLTETFVQREVRELMNRKGSLEIYSLWGGRDEFEGVRVHRFHKWKMIALCWKIPFLLFRKPKIFRNLFLDLKSFPIPSLLNVGETFIGMLFAFTYANHFSKRAPDLIHAIWGTMPATAAQLLSRLTGVPFSMEAHAYDIYENGGDWNLRRKFAEARFIRTSSKSAQEDLIRLGANPSRVFHIRRGLKNLPSIKEIRALRKPIRILSIGRLIEKKGFFHQLKICQSLQSAGIPFDSRIIGKGPFWNRLSNQINTLGLGNQVKLLGAMKHEAVLNHYAWADVFLFTGITARNGDRDGFPNVIAEAMAIGIPVVASTSAELIASLTDYKNALLLDVHHTQDWKDAIKELSQDDQLYRFLQLEGRTWVEKNFDIQNTAKGLNQCFEKF